MTKFGHGLAVLGLVGLGALAALGQTAQLLDTPAMPIWPDRIAPVYADGTLGPWQDYIRRDRGNTTQVLTPIWDNYETCDEYNYTDITVGERYEPYCLGECDGRRYIWSQGTCDFRGVIDVWPSKTYATGGVMAKGGGGKKVDVMSLIFGICLGNSGPRDVIMVIELTDTYSGNDCEPPADDLSGVAMLFAEIPEGLWRTTVDLIGEGLSMETPADGTLGIRVTNYFVYDPRDPENNVFADSVFSGLWVTKAAHADEMGIQDDFHFDDSSGDNNGELTEVDCFNSGPFCEDDHLGPMFLLLSEGGGVGECEPCDTNCDGSVDLTDVEPFICLLLRTCDPCCPRSGDTNDDGSVDLTDVEPFIECLLG